MGKQNATAHNSKAANAEPVIPADKEEGENAAIENILPSTEDATTSEISADDNAYRPFTPAVKYAWSLFGSYQECLTAEPLKTKMITSCVISMIGEVLGGYLKQRRYISSHAVNRNQRQVMLGNMPPIFDLKRLAIFGVYGFAITGPIFHWWYGFLEKTVRSWQINSGNMGVLAKIAMDRLVFTPPFLLFTLAYMQFLQTFNVAKTSAAIKNIYAGAIYLNWKVWTVAQAVNFKYVPLEYRVLFGNLVALWWNVMLSLKN